MPEMSGIDLLRRLRERGSDVPVIVITGHGDIPLAVEAMKFGAADFFEKPYDDDALLAAVRSALDRHESAEKQSAARAEINERLATLSNRERQVLEGLVAGKPNKIIAFDHGISPRTVEIYRANVMTKMQASSLSELVRMAMIAGILDDCREAGRAVTLDGAAGGDACLSLELDQGCYPHRGVACQSAPMTRRRQGRCGHEHITATFRIARSCHHRRR